MEVINIPNNTTNLSGDNQVEFNRKVKANMDDLVLLTQQANRPYKVYTVLLDQAGTAAPVATILEDSVTGVTVARSAQGVSTFTTVGKWTSGKTIPTVDRYVDPSGNLLDLVWTSANVMTLSAYSAGNWSIDDQGVITGTLADDILTARFMSITVYN